MDKANTAAAAVCITIGVVAGAVPGLLAAGGWLVWRRWRKGSAGAVPPVGSRVPPLDAAGAPPPQEDRR